MRPLALGHAWGTGDCPRRRAGSVLSAPGRGSLSVSAGLQGTAFPARTEQSPRVPLSFLPPPSLCLCRSIWPVRVRRDRLPRHFSAGRLFAWRFGKSEQPLCLMSTKEAERSPPVTSALPLIPPGQDAVFPLLERPSSLCHYLPVHLRA